MIVPTEVEEWRKMLLRQRSLRLRGLRNLQPDPKGLVSHNGKF